MPQAGFHKQKFRYLFILLIHVAAMNWFNLKDIHLKNNLLIKFICSLFKSFRKCIPFAKQNQLAKFIHYRYLCRKSIALFFNACFEAIEWCRVQRSNDFFVPMVLGQKIRAGTDHKVCHRLQLRKSVYIAKVN